MSDTEDSNITEKQFLDALKIVKQYKTQVNELIVNSLEDDRLKTKIDDFISNVENNGGEISLRLKNVLRMQIKIRYIEDFNMQNFLSIANAGKKTWVEFCELTGKYNNR